MPSKMMWLFVLLVTCVSPLSAGTYWVGTCHAGSFSSISAAVKSPSVTSGSTINVCPGTYQEQVIVSKPLTLHGLMANRSSGAKVLIKQTANLSVTESGVLETDLIPIIWVTTGPVTIENIHVDVLQPVPCTPPQVVGFYYSSGAFGKINGVVFESFDACPGWGIWVENNSNPTSITISNSFSDSGILTAATEPLPDIRLKVNVTGNQIYVNKGIGQGMFISQVGGAVSGNFIQTAPVGAPTSYQGIYDDAPSATVSGNTIVGDDFTIPSTEEIGNGIVINDDGATVTSNQITSVSTAITLNCHSATVTGNTITLALNGLVEVPSSFAGSNTFYSTGTNTDRGKNNCP